MFLFLLFIIYFLFIYLLQETVQATTQIIREHQCLLNKNTHIYTPTHTPHTFF